MAINFFSYFTRQLSFTHFEHILPHLIFVYVSLSKLILGILLSHFIPLLEAYHWMLKIGSIVDFYRDLEMLMDD